MSFQPTTGNEILQYFSHVSSRRGTFEFNWQELADHGLGRREFISQKEHGRNRMIQIYDNTALLSGDLFIAGLHSLVTNPYDNWFFLEPEDDRLMEEEGVPEWHQFVQDLMYSNYNAMTSRFHPQAHELYYDFGHMGTGGFWVGDKPGAGPIFSARPLGEMYLEADADGSVSTIFRKFRYTAVQAAEAWGHKVPMAMKDLERQPYNEREYVQWVRKNDSPIHGSPFKNGKKWLSTHVSIDDKAITQEGGYQSNPFMTPRMNVDGKEVYGRGSGYISLPAIKMANMMKYTILKSALKNVDPPLAYDADSVAGTLSTEPGTAVPVNNTGNTNTPIQSFGIDGDVRLGLDMLENEARGIKSAYKAELLQILQDPRMTATQVLEVSNTMKTLFSPTQGRLETEWLHPLSLRHYDILVEQGKIPEPPPAMSGQNFKIKFVSPVTRAQKEAKALQGVEAMTIMTNASVAIPDILDNIDTDDWAKMVLESKSVTSLLRPKEDVIAIREQRAQEAAIQAQKEEQMNAIETIGKAAPALDALGAGQAAEGAAA